MFRRSAVFCAAVLTAIALPSGVAMAQTSRPATPKLVPHGYWQYRAAYKTYKGAFSGDWVHCLYITKQKSPLTYTCTKSVTVSESVTGNVGFTDGEISSSVGWNVSYSTGVSVAASVKVKAGGSGWLDDGFRYQRYIAGMEKRWCVQTLILTCNAWSKPDAVTVQRHIGNTFYYFGTGAE